LRVLYLLEITPLIVILIEIIRYGINLNSFRNRLYDSKTIFLFKNKFCAG